MGKLMALVLAGIVAVAAAGCAHAIGKDDMTKKDEILKK